MFGPSLKNKAKQMKNKRNMKATVENKTILLSMHST